MACGWLIASPVKLDVELSHQAIKAEKKNKVYLRVKLTGEKVSENRERTPLNVALVLDRSGSMSGDKIARTKKAAIAFVNRLEADDIVSIVIYDDRIDTLLAATKLRDKRAVIRKIEQIFTGGSTALYGGVVQGAFEVRKFKDKTRVNRIILLSDGQANVGPSSVQALGKLGSSLAKEGISVTTLGLGNGYNEDLMSALAAKSDGNHKFLRTSADVEHFFNKELGVMGMIVAKNISIDIACRNGVKALRVLDVDATMENRHVKSGFNQVYGGHERYMMVELEVPAKAMGSKNKLVDVSLSYYDLKHKIQRKQQKGLVVPAKKLAKENKDVMVSAVEQLATLANAKAVKLRDQGKIEAAKKALQRNSAMLKSKAKAYNSSKLMEQSAENDEAMENLDDAKWNVQRKQMRDKQTKRFFKGAL
jgi:Ca-activated chloride channel family protein